MKIIIFLFLLFILASCEGNKNFKSNDNSKKTKKIIMNVTTEPTVKVKK
tara:strand:- start:339 stop:485 length:147 start_codon:yes stop_codon:yes gene_type:complete